MFKRVNNMNEMECGLKNEFDFISSTHKSYKKLIDFLPEQTVKPFGVKPRSSRLRNKGDIIKMLFFSMNEGYKITVRDSESKAVIGSSRIVRVSDDFFTINKCGIDSKSKNIIISIEGEELRFAFSSEVLKNIGGVSIDVSIPNGVDNIERVANIGINLKHTNSAAAYISFYDLNIGLIGKITKISDSGIVVEFSDDVFIEPYYIMVNGAIGCSEPPFVVVTKSISGKLESFIATISDVDRSDGYSIITIRFLDLNFINSSLGELSNLGFNNIEKSLSSNEETIINVFGYPTVVSRTGETNSSLLLEDSFFETFTSDGQYCVCELNGQYFISKYNKADRKLTYLSRELNDSYEIYGTSDYYKKEICEVRDDSLKYDRIKRTLNIIGEF